MGDVVAAPRTHAAPEVRFWRRVDKRGPDECWLWLGGHNGTTGHGVFELRKRKRVVTSRYSYMLSHGLRALSADVLVHHTCENPPCVNPNHLVARSRIKHAAEHKAERTACNHGHVYGPGTYYLRGNYKQCKICVSERKRRYRECAKVSA